MHLTTLRPGDILDVEKGFLICPRCRRNRKLLRVANDSSGKRIAVYCGVCKSEILVDISDGQVTISK